MTHDPKAEGDGARSAFAAQRAWRQRNPMKRRAHELVQRAKRRGEMVPRPCEACGAVEDVHAHHDDYGDPLSVRWLCREHHRQWHSENLPIVPSPPLQPTDDDTP